MSGNAERDSKNTVNVQMTCFSLMQQDSSDVSANPKFPKTFNVLQHKGELTVSQRLTKNRRV